MDLSLLFLHRQWASRTVLELKTARLPFAGLQSALGSLPSVALSSAGANGFAPPPSLSVFKGSVSRFRFLGGL
jgi:hypothetical protein